jgi:hypothetical protein
MNIIVDHMPQLFEIANDPEMQALNSNLRFDGQ